MIRPCNNTCHLRLQCQSVRTRISELPAEVDATEKETIRLLNLSSALLAETKLADDLGAEQKVLDAMDDQLDVFTSVQLNKQKLHELQKQLWILSAVSKLAVATCIGPIRGHCSSPLGFIIERLQANDSTTETLGV
jgi:hypothetical protein